WMVARSTPLPSTSPASAPPPNKIKWSGARLSLLLLHGWQYRSSLGRRFCARLFADAPDADQVYRLPRMDCHPTVAVARAWSWALLVSEPRRLCGWGRLVPAGDDSGPRHQLHQSLGVAKSVWSRAAPVNGCRLAAPIRRLAQGAGVDAGSRSGLEG